MSSGRTVGQKAKGEKYKQFLSDSTAHMPPDVAQAIRQGQKYGQWLNILPRYCNHTVLGAQEFHDSLLVQYQSTPSDLLVYCNGCGKKLTLTHILESKLGGLIIVRHNEDSSTKKKPDDNNNNSPVHANKTSKDNNSELRGDVSIQGLWQNQTDSIIDI
eukprot:3196112-Ditylum_brightwellii.AAC.1